MKTYLIAFRPASGIIWKEIKARTVQEARKEARSIGPIYAGPTEKIVLPDKIVRRDNF
jgi:hypothetical protein